MDVQSLHNILISLHAASATISFFAGGLLILSRKYTSNRMLFGVYWWTLVGMVVLLAGAMIVYRAGYSGTERIIFPGLLGLGIYMLYRAKNASRLLKSQQDDWRLGYIEHIGFTLISLFEGFFIVTVLNAGGPGWLVALLAIFGVGSLGIPVVDTRIWGCEWRRRRHSHPQIPAPFHDKAWRTLVFLLAAG